MSVLGNVIFVRDQNDGVSLTVQIGEQGHDFLAGARVEVSRRLVGQDDRRRIHQGARNGNALALPTGKLIGLVVHAVGQVHAA